MRFSGIVIAFAPAIGPSLSGWIVDHMPWQVLFYMMLPIAIIDLIIAYFMLKNVTERTFPRLDVTSIILSTFGFGGLLFGFGTAGDAGWISTEVLLPLAIGAISLTLFIYRQFKLEQPILEFRILRYRIVTLNILLDMLVFIVSFGCSCVLPHYYQDMNQNTALEH